MQNMKVSDSLKEITSSKLNFPPTKRQDFQKQHGLRISFSFRLQGFAKNVMQLCFL